MCYNALDERFQTPEVKSNRVQRLKGMTYEAQGDWGRANLVYEEMLKKDPTNMARLPPAPAAARAPSDPSNPRCRRCLLRR